MLKRKNYPEAVQKNVGILKKSGDAFRIKLKRLVVDRNGEAIDFNTAGITNAYLGNQIDKNDIFIIVNKLDNYLAQLGYVTSNVTLAPSNISNGILLLKTNLGRVSKIIVNGHDPITMYGKMLVFQLLPLAENKVLNIHDIDQIVENGNNFAKTIKVTILPDDRDDYSNLNIVVSKNNINITCHLITPDRESLRDQEGIATLWRQITVIYFWAVILSA